MLPPLRSDSKANGIAWTDGHIKHCNDVQ